MILDPTNLSILLIEHREEYRAVYGLNLIVYLDSKVTVVSTKNDVVKELKDKNQQYNLIFLDNDAYTGDMALDLYKLLSEKNLNIPFYVVGKTKLGLNADHVYKFDKSLELKYILGPMAEGLNITAKMMALKSHGPYFSMPIDFLIPGWQCSADLFISIGDAYKLMFKVGDIILNDELEFMTKSGIKHLFVDSTKRLKFVNSLTNEIFAKLNDPDLTKEDRVHVTAKGYQMVMEQARRLGITQTTLDIANECISSMKNIVEVFDNLNDLLAELIKEDGSYRYKHSLLCSYVGIHLLKKLSWGSKEEQDKFIFLCFFHDIALPRDDWARIHHDEDLKGSSLTDDEKEIISSHASAASKIISKVNKIPFGIDLIIKQHHGSKNGKGLSKISNEISPLAALFILAEEWTSYAIQSQENQEKLDKKKVIQKITIKYDFPVFKKLFPALHSLEL